jgi:hypothetical protein
MSVCWKSVLVRNVWSFAGGGEGRVFRVGRQPINASLQAYATAVKHNNFGDVTIRAQVQYLFPQR